MKRFLALVLASGFISTSLVATTAQAGLTINLDFSNFNNGAPADGSAVLGGNTRAAAQDVIQTAADYWEAAFVNSTSTASFAVGGTITQNIDVVWGPQSNSTLATGGTGFFIPSGAYTQGTLTFDNDGTSTFFVDNTPTDNAEWQQFSGRSINAGGVNDINVERQYYDAPAGTVRDNNDLLSIAMHEIGHALGFFDNYPLYDAADIGNDGDLDITSGAFAGSELALSPGHFDINLDSPGNGDFPYDPGGNSFFTTFTIGTPILGPSIVTGTRKLLTEADIAAVGEFLAFDQNTINFNPSLVAAVPEPGTMLVLALIGGVTGVRRYRRR